MTNLSSEYINKKTTLFIVITQTIMVAWSVGSSILHSGPTSAYIITIGSFILYAVYALMSKNQLLLKLLLFGFVAGVLELWADHYSVATIKTLIYPPGEDIIVSSPTYMPFSWAIALTQLGYYSLLLVRWKGMGIAMLLMALSGGLYIPLYEHLAKNADWWYYQNCSMIFHAPYYIIICEALVSLALPPLVVWMHRKKVLFSIVPGIIEGLWILVSAMIAYAIAP